MPCASTCRLRVLAGRTDGPHPYFYAFRGFFKIDLRISVKAPSTLTHLKTCHVTVHVQRACAHRREPRADCPHCSRSLSYRKRNHERETTMGKSKSRDFMFLDDDEVEVVFQFVLGSQFLCPSARQRSPRESSIESGMNGNSNVLVSRSPGNSGGAWTAPRAPA